ncbi:MAG: MATE family efflux transporter [Verrucomicrobiota bacterium]
MPNSSKDQESEVTMKGMLSLAFPIIVIHVALVAMQFADAWMVGILGADALAAILPAGLVFFVPISFGMGLLGAVSTFTSQSLGSGTKKDCGDYTWQGIWVGLLLGVLILMTWWAAPALFGLFDHEPRVQALEVVYYRIMLFGAIPQLVLLAVSNFFIGIHRTQILAWTAVGATILNILLNYVLIFGHAGFPELGFAGAAWGTVIALCVQCSVLFCGFLFFGDPKIFGTRRVQVHPKRMWDLLKVGVPSGFQIGLELLSWSVALVWMVGLFGTLHLAATTIGVRLMHLSFMPPAALAIVLTAMVGKSVGQGNIERAQRQVVLALKLCCFYMGGIGLLFFFGRYALPGLFTDDPEVIQIAAGVMICVAAFQLFDAMNIVFIHALKGAGDTFWPAVVTLLICCVVFIGGGLVVVYWIPSWGSWGIWTMGTSYLILLSGFMALRWYSGKWKQIKLLENAQ